eukprot:ANDGO_04194.mRNA.1 hypothetical protein
MALADNSHHHSEGLDSIGSLPPQPPQVPSRSPPTIRSSSLSPHPMESLSDPSSSMIHHHDHDHDLHHHQLGRLDEQHHHVGVAHPFGALSSDEHHYDAHHEHHHHHHDHGTRLHDDSQLHESMHGHSSVGNELDRDDDEDEDEQDERNDPNDHELDDDAHHEMSASGQVSDSSISRQVHTGLDTQINKAATSLPPTMLKRQVSFSSEHDAWLMSAINAYGSQSKNGLRPAKRKKIAEDFQRVFPHVAASEANVSDRVKAIRKRQQRQKKRSESESGSAAGGSPRLHGAEGAGTGLPIKRARSEQSQSSAATNAGSDFHLHHDYDPEWKRMRLDAHGSYGGHHHQQLQQRHQQQHQQHRHPHRHHHQQQQQHVDSGGAYGHDPTAVHHLYPSAVSHHHEHDLRVDNHHDMSHDQHVYHYADHAVGEEGVSMVDSADGHAHQIHQLHAPLEIQQSGDSSRSLPNPLSRFVNSHAVATNHILQMSHALSAGHHAPTPSLAALTFAAVSQSQQNLHLQHQHQHQHQQIHVQPQPIHVQPQPFVHVSPGQHPSVPPIHPTSSAASEVGSHSNGQRHHAVDGQRAVEIHDSPAEHLPAREELHARHSEKTDKHELGQHHSKDHNLEQTPTPGSSLSTVGEAHTSTMQPHDVVALASNAESTSVPFTKVSEPSVTASVVVVKSAEIHVAEPEPASSEPSQTATILASSSSLSSGSSSLPSSSSAAAAAAAGVAAAMPSSTSASASSSSSSFAPSAQLSSSTQSQSKPRALVDVAFPSVTATSVELPGVGTLTLTVPSSMASATSQAGSGHDPNSSGGFADVLHDPRPEVQILNAKITEIEKQLTSLSQDLHICLMLLRKLNGETAGL